MRTIVELTNGLTERGNLKQAVRNELKAQAVDNFLGDFEVTPKGDYVMHIANVDGKPVYIKVNLTISDSEKLFDEPKAKEKAVETVDVPNLFE